MSPTKLLCRKMTATGSKIKNSNWLKLYSQPLVVMKDWKSFIEYLRFTVILLRPWHCHPLNTGGVLNFSNKMWLPQPISTLNRLPVRYLCFQSLKLVVFNPSNYFKTWSFRALSFLLGIQRKVINFVSMYMKEGLSPQIT